MRNGTVFSLKAITLTALVSTAAMAADDGSKGYLDFQFSPEHPYYFKDGKVDFGTYNGFRRYHSECHVCHGPAGLGSSYAPALMKSMQVLDFNQFVNVVIHGRVGLDERVMPSFASNMNVLPYLNDIYAYLKARADGVIGTARPDRFPKVKTDAQAAAK